MSWDIPGRPEWHADALCTDAPTDTFFPSKGGDVGTHWRRAREWCDACPVSAECLADAFRQESEADSNLRYGMRGGATPNERHYIAGTGSAAQRMDGGASLTGRLAGNVPPFPIDALPPWPSSSADGR